MNAVAAGKDVDEFGESINNVEKVLRNYGIQLRDTVTNDFRPLGDVLDELSKSWNTYGTTEKAQIAGAMAGVRQYSNLIAMMDNYNLVLKGQTIETQSAGLEAERFAIYQQGVEAALNRSKAAWEGVWQATIDSGAIKFFLNLSAEIGNNITRMGGLIPVVVALVGAFVMLKAVAVTKFLLDMSTAISGAITGFKVLIGVLETTALTAQATGAAITGGISLIITAIAAVVLAYTYFHKTAAETLDDINSKIDEHKSKLESLKSSASSLAGLSEEYEKLRDTQNRTNEEESRFIELQNEIHRILPQVSGNYDEMGNYIFTAGVNQETLNGLMKEQIIIEQELLRLKIIEGLDARIKGLKDLQTEQDKLNKKIDYYNNLSVGGKRPQQLVDVFKQEELTNAQIKASETAAQVAATIAVMRQEYWSSTPAVRALAIEKYKLAGYSQDLINKITEETAVLSGEVPVFEDVAAAVEEAAQTVGDLISSFQTLQSAMDEQDQTGQLSIQTVLRLIDAGYAQILQINAETGAFEINWQALRMVAIEKAQQAQDTAYEAYMNRSKDATDAETAALLRTWQALTMVIEKLKSAPTVPKLFTGFFSGGGDSGGSNGSRISAEEAYKKKIEETTNATIRAKEAEKKRLQEALEAYKKIIDAKKESLRLAKEESDFNKELTKKQHKSADIMAELESIALDNSQEAAARRLELQQELADNQLEIEEFQNDRSYELQVEALDKEYAVFKDFIDAQTALIDKAIEALREMLRLLNATSTSTGSSVGGGGENESTVPPLTRTNSNTRIVPAFGGNDERPMMRRHSGIDTGFVGNAKSNSEFAELMKGELVINPPQMERFMSRILPDVVQNSNVGGNQVSFEMPIQVMGNLDKTVLPDIEKIVNKAFEKMNKTLLTRGYLRSVNQYSS